MYVPIEDGPAMREGGRVQQCHVGEIGQHRRLHLSVRRYRASGANPYVLTRLQFLAAGVVLQHHGAHFYRPLPLPVAPDALGNRG